jgi:hypothetical protein
VQAKFRAVIGYDNDKAPVIFHRKAVYVTFLAETSDGELLDFRRIRWGFWKSAWPDPWIDKTLQHEKVQEWPRHHIHGGVD